jgi:uncharacterized protein YfaS (alpha-2-macroglobulin family)
VLRDSAAMLTLASETKASIDLVALSRRVEQERQSSPHTSTQEDAWSLMAANALMQNLAAPNLVVDGEPVAGRCSATSTPPAWRLRRSGSRTAASARWKSASP